MTDDLELLRKYVQTNSQEAFSELVQRHIGFVYAAAIRMGRGTARAEDITQQVFIDLARKAASLSHRRELVGWLYLSTRYAAVSAIRSDIRRTAREQEAQMRHDDARDDAAPTDWTTLRPMLDEALHELGETDRTAVLLRFFRNDSFLAIARALGLSEEAARKRLERALEKLHAGLARRGVTSTAAALGVALGHQPAVAVPAGLAATVAAAAWQGTAATAGAGAAVTGTGAIFMASKTATITVGIAAMLALGLLLIQREKTKVAESAIALAQDELAGIKREREGLQARLRQAEQARADAERQIVQLQATNKALAATPPPPPRIVPTTSEAPQLPAQQQMAMMNNLRMIAAALSQFKVDYGRAPNHLAEIVGNDKYIKGLTSVAGEDYAGLSLNGDTLILTTPNGITLRYLP